MGGSYTEPRILMESIRSPGKVLELDQESTWSPSGVHQESIRSLPGVHQPAAIVHFQRILLDSRYTPAGLLMESIRMETFPGLLIQSLKTRAGLSRWSLPKPI